MWSYKRIALVLVMVLVGFGVVCLAETAGGESKERILHFPKERSLGRIMVIDANIKRRIQTFYYSGDGVDWYQQAEYLGEAQGDVIIPAGKKTALFFHKNAIKDLSPLLNLQPDDLYMLTIPLPWNTNIPLTGKCMRYIAHLTGLKVLKLYRTRTTTEGMKHIAKLQSLEWLTLPQGLTNRGLSYVAQLKSLKGLSFTENRVNNAGLNRYLPKLTKLEELRLYGEQISDAGLVRLAELPLLRCLSLRNGNFTDAGLAYVKDIPTLKILDISWLPITDAGVHHLSGHAGLENLSLYTTLVTNRSLAYLKSMPSLKKLNIGKRNIDRENPAITDAGMVHLAQINSLEYLDLPNYGITDKGLAPISNLKNLKHLWVCGSSSSPLTDTALQHVSKLQSLEYLLINGTGFTNTGMDDLAKLTNLRELNLRADLITNQGLAKLKTLKSLERLSLGCKKITISGLSYLNELKNISYLEVEGIKQDNSGLDISGLSKLEEFWFTLNFPPKRNKLVFDLVRDEDLACLKKLKNLRDLVIERGKSSMITDAGIAYLKDLPDMRELNCGSPYLTDKSLSYLANIKTLNSLTITGNFTDDGLGYLGELKALLGLKIYSGNKFSPAAVMRLRKKLPNIRTFEVKKNEPERKRPRRRR